MEEVQRAVQYLRGKFKVLHPFTYRRERSEMFASNAFSRGDRHTPGSLDNERRGSSTHDICQRSSKHPHLTQFLGFDGSYSASSRDVRLRYIRFRNLAKSHIYAPPLPIKMEHAGAGYKAARVAWR